MPIDETAEKLDSTEESLSSKGEASKIPPEAEFWAHCSNLQVWAENEYLSNLLH